MRQFERRRVAMLARVRDFGARYGHLFPDSTTAHGVFGELTRIVATLEAHEAAERTAAIARRASRKQEARRVLVASMRRIARTASIVPHPDPNFSGHFRIPGPGYDLRLLTVAREVSRRAATCAAAFIDRGLSPTFIADLDALIARFEDALRTRQAGEADAAAAKTGIKLALAAGLAILPLLDTVVFNHISNDAATRAAWVHTRRIGDPRRRNRARTSTRPDERSSASEPAQ